jgi:hypothetical protein
MVLTLLSLVVGYLTAQFSDALLMALLYSGPFDPMSAEFTAIILVCSLGFATLSGYLTGLVAQRSPIAHAGLLCLLLSAVWAVSILTIQTAPTIAIPTTSLVSLAITVIGVMTGGWLRLRQAGS